MVVNLSSKVRECHSRTVSGVIMMTALQVTDRCIPQTLLKIFPYLGSVCNRLLANIPTPYGLAITVGTSDFDSSTALLPVQPHHVLITVVLYRFSFNEVKSQNCHVCSSLLGVSPENGR